MLQSKSRPLNCRGGFVLFLDKKNQKSRQQKCFCAQGPIRTFRQKLGLPAFCPTTFPLAPRLLQNSEGPFLPSGLLLLPDFPKAVLLSEIRIKKSAGLSEKRATRWT